MKIILFGSSGQLGLSFMKKVPQKLEIITPLRSEIDLGIENDIETFEIPFFYKFHYFLFIFY
mgnify:CR=1 FL=1